MEIFCYFAGVALVSMRSLLPLSILIVAGFFRLRVRLLCFFLAAVAWTWMHQYMVSDHGLPATGTLVKVNLAGYIMTIPTVTATRTQFQYQITEINHQPVRALVLLSCYKNCAVMHVSEKCSMTATLRRSRNLSNPGGFDYVSWLRARHLHWSGTVMPGSIQKLSEPNINLPWMRIRAHLADGLATVGFDLPVLGVVEALTLGLTTHIDQDHWRLFRQTGTTHLMVISGAHIGLVAGLIYKLVKKIACCFELLCLRFTAQKIASIFSFIAALLYALLAGFAVPAQRALIMTFFVFVRTVFSQRLTSWQSLRYALFVVLIWEPDGVLTPGFYLSFLAVTCLMVTHQRFKCRGIKNVLLIQLGCLFGLMPLTLYWFAYGAVNGLIANVLAIPWVGFVVVPLALFSTLLGLFMTVSWVNALLELSVNLLLRYLTFVDSFSLVNLTTGFQTLLSPICLMMAMILLLLMPWRRWWYVVSCLFIGAVVPGHNHVVSGAVQVDVLDVGQGLSVIARTANHILVYDTGVQFYQGSDMGAMVVVPYLKFLGIKKLDKIIISHPDLDHRGGLRSIDQAYPGTELIVDDPAFYHRGVSCHHTREWLWDGVKFRFFSLSGTKKSKNNTSCVLQISTPVAQVLLTGDIEKPAETLLVKLYGSMLSSTVIVVPHHGSKTSSSAAFVDAVGPKYAVISYGYDNKYHFPHEQAISAYTTKGSIIYNTVTCGMTSLLLHSSTAIIKPYCYNNKLLEFNKV